MNFVKIFLKFKLMLHKLLLETKDATESACLLCFFSFFESHWLFLYYHENAWTITHLQHTFNCSKSTTGNPDRCHWRFSVLFIVNFEEISYLFLVSLLLTLKSVTMECLLRYFVRGTLTYLRLAIINN